MSASHNAGVIRIHLAAAADDAVVDDGLQVFKIFLS